MNILKSFNSLPKKKKYALIGSTIIIVLTLISLFPSSTPASISTQTNVQLPIQKYYPDPPSQSTTKSLKLESVSKTIAYTYIPSSTDQTIILFNQIAAEFGLDSTYQELSLNDSSHLIWSNLSSYLDVNLDSGQFVLKPLAQTDNSNIIDQGQALNIAKNWLLKYNLIDSDFSHQVTYLAQEQSEAYPTNNPNLADIFRIKITPQLNSLPIYSSDFNTHPIIVDISKSGNIFQISYNLPAHTYSQYQKNSSHLTSTPQPIVSKKELTQAIQNGQAVITSATTNTNIFTSLQKTVQTTNYTQASLGYQVDPKKHQFILVYKLIGTGKLEDNQEVNITAYISAVQ